MEIIEYRTVDKSAWGPGPWQDEPDKMQWQDEATGLPCLIVRNRHGALCGYAGVAPGHPWHRVYYASRSGYEQSTDLRFLPGGTEPEAVIDVHGGITFSGGCGHGPDESRGICHKPAPGEPDDVWWFGFDCAHCDDLAPHIAAHSRTRYAAGPDEVYRDLAYVRAEVASLARQLAAVTA